MKKIFDFFICLSLSFTLFETFLLTELNACTGIKLQTKDGSIVHGRTLEFGIDLDLSAVVIPKGYQFISTTSQDPGLTYQSKYATVGTITFNDLAIWN